MEFRVGREESGQRLDVFLASHRELSLSREQVKKAALMGKVQVNARPAKVGQRVREGDAVTFEKPPSEDYQVLPEEIPLNIVYEDAGLLVVDKPAGMVVHPAAGNYRGTLVNALLFHCRDLSGIGGVKRPGIVHRLDKGTSGLMVVAKSDPVHQALADQFETHRVKKTYEALVYGDPKEESGIIDVPVGRDSRDRKKMSTRSQRGKEARTHWMVRERYGLATLLEIDLETGRTHQIRVHLTQVGHPLVGDPVYGGAGRAKSVADPAVREKLKSLHRPALHASRLSFSHPLTGRSLCFSSPLPQDIASLCDFLRSYHACHRLFTRK